ncbi:hypothetical protein Hanom_Chr05g00470661 [Helianthus anomalus]
MRRSIGGYWDSPVVERRQREVGDGGWGEREAVEKGGGEGGGERGNHGGDYGGIVEKDE